MKFSAIAVAGTIALASAASAEADVEYKPYTKELAKDSFFEQFDSPESGWKPSSAKKDGKDAYVGKWEIEESTVNPGLKGDKGLVVKSEAALHAISYTLPQVFDNKDNTLVLQYEVKLQNGLDCGGAYIKLLDAEGAPTEDDEFSNNTPYQVMFGPDKCGSVNKVHFIIRRKNPHTGKYEEKALKSTPMARIVKTSVLYTLIIKPNQDFEIRIDGEVVRSGSLLDPHYFALVPPETIPDPESTKPESWNDEEYIRDPEAKKPADWDESAPFMITDTKAKKPADWDEDMPTSIPDPDATKPAYWDDDEDGVWEAPPVPNDECEAHGCGPWTAPKIKNPDYKGKWFPPMIKNPEYDGEWTPSVIPNPEYYKDETPADLEPIGALGFELWTMTRSIMFNNIYLGHSIEEAENIGNSTFVPKVKLEEEAAAANTPDTKFEPDEPAEQYEDAEGSWFSDLADKFIDDAVAVLGKANNFVVSLTKDPLHTIMNRPGEAVLFSAVLLSSFTLFFGVSSVLVYFLTGGAAVTPPEKAAEKKVAEAIEKKENDESMDGEVEAIEEVTKPSESEVAETEATKRS